MAASWFAFTAAFQLINSGGQITWNGPLVVRYARHTLFVNPIVQEAKLLWKEYGNVTIGTGDSFAWRQRVLPAHLQAIYDHALSANTGVAD